MSPIGRAGEGLRRPASCPPCSLSGRREARAAATHIEQMIVNEKSSLGFMLHVHGIIVHVPPIGTGIYMEEWSGLFEFWYSATVAW